MSTSTNVNNITYGKTLLIALSIGTSSIIFPLDNDFAQTEPTQIANYVNIENNELLDYNYFNTESSLSNTDKQGVIIQFAGNLLNGQKNIEQEYVDFVNNNFWDLI